MTEPTSFALICAAEDDLARVVADYHQQRPKADGSPTTVEDMRAAARRLLETRQQVEIRKWGKAKTVISPLTIARCLW